MFNAVYPLKYKTLMNDRKTNETNGGHGLKSNCKTNETNGSGQNVQKFSRSFSSVLSVRAFYVFSVVVVAVVNVCALHEKCSSTHPTCRQSDTHF